MDGGESRILLIFFDIILPLIVGYMLHQKQLISNDQCNTLIRFNIIVIVTILTFLSFWILPLRGELMLLPFFSFFNAFLPLGIVLALGLHKRFHKKIDQGSYLVATIPSNIGTLGGLCGYLLYGELSFAYVQIIGVFQNFVMLFLLFPMGYYYEHNGENVGLLSFFEKNWKGVFINWNQFSIFGILAGMILSTLGTPRPPVLGTVFQSLVHINAWCALLPIGYLIDFSTLKLFYSRTLNLIPIKLIIPPLVSYGIATWFTTDPVLLGTLIICMATPCAINSLVTARLYNLNVNLAMAPFITTTILYIGLLYPAFYLLVSSGWLPFR